MKRIILLTTALLFAGMLLKANNIQFSASAPRVVETGEQFQISYNISAEPSGFKPPEFKGLSLLGGPSRSSSSSIQLINGKVTQSSSYSFTYYFVANTAGTYTIEPAKATVEGKTYMSNAVTIEVAGNARQSNGQQPANQQSTSQPTASRTNAANDGADVSNDDIFVRVITDKTSVYQGEAIVAIVKIFSKPGLSAIEKEELPSFNGFFSQEIETPPLQSLEREVVNGQVYNTGVLKRLVLFPQKSGDIIIDPCMLQVVAQIPVRRRTRSIFDDFWGAQAQEVRKKVTSKALKIAVKALPANAPASFKGAVGIFSFKAQLDKQTVKTNDAINLKIGISGAGNLKTIDAFDIAFPSDFETYDPKITVNANANTNGVAGSKYFEYLIIPRHSGDFKIPPLEFTYFDLKAQQYKTLSSGEMLVTVKKGADEGNATVVTGVSKEDVKFLGKDIQFIKTDIGHTKPIGSYLFGSTLFVLSYLLALLLFVIVILVLRKKIKQNANVSYVKNKKANKIAHKRLKDAHIYMKNNQIEEFYEYVLKALWGYMSDKLSIPVSELSRGNVTEAVQRKNIDAGLLQKFIELVDTCEFARYAPSAGTSQIETDYEAAIGIITKLEQKMR